MPPKKSFFARICERMSCGKTPVSAGKDKQGGVCPGFHMRICNVSDPQEAPLHTTQLWNRGGSGDGGSVTTWLPALLPGP